jgi:phosphatidate cytidylyltransferase
VKRVLTAVILIPLVILALFKAPLWLFTLLVLGVALLAAKEYFDIAEATGFRPFRRLSYLFLSCTFLAAYVAGTTKADLYSHWAGLELEYLATASSVLVLLSPFVLLAGGMRREPLPRALPDSASSFLLLPYVGFSLASMILMRGGHTGALFLLFLMLLVWCGDIAAYYVGRAIGKNKLAPRISPGKTWEGAIASVVCAIVVGLLLFHYINPIVTGFRSAHLLNDLASLYYSALSNEPRRLPIAPWWFAAVFAVCVNVAAQLGDLVESALKRGAGLKDSGTLLPGHGGVLDRIDALLFALPVGLLFYVSGMSRYFEPGVR